MIMTPRAAIIPLSLSLAFAGNVTARLLSPFPAETRARSPHFSDKTSPHAEATLLVHLIIGTYSSAKAPSLQRRCKANPHSPR